MFEIQKFVKALSEIPTRIEDTKGIALSTVSKECQTLAIRCNCTSLSYLFILPQCYDVSRQALVVLRKWLSEDRQYNDFIHT